MFKCNDQSDMTEHPQGLRHKDWTSCEKAVTPDFPKETKCKPICMPGSSFMHIVTYK
jgi:hypothetical protein